MKILFAIKKMDGAVGGAERVLAEIASRLAADGDDVSLLSFDAPGGTSFYPLHPSIRRIHLPLGNPGQKATFAETLRRIPALRRAVRREAPDIAIGFMHSMFVLLGPALLGTGIPVLGSEHTSPATYRERPVEGRMLRLVLPALRAVTVPSDAVRDFYPAAARAKIHVLANPVAAPPKIDPPAARTKTILAVGRLQPVKDHATLIDAFARLAPQYPDWRLRIVGEGPLRSQLEAQIASAGLQGHIELPGIATDIAGEYARAAIFAMPSENESFGLALAEALAAGLPAIGFASCAGCRALIRDGTNGILLVTGDRPWRLAEGLSRLMRDDGLRARLGANGPISVEAYGIGNIVGKWKALLRQITMGG